MNTEQATGTNGLVWFRSSHSGNEGGNCVEVAAGSEAVRVRDSKDRAGGTLAFPPAAWSAFVGFAGGATVTE
ncbi:DUF397 domain-containing protein [Streptomyces sp. TRM43335]|uniref:DUF397 domain-containing protein n=1 Tax=Streptomyces taklimakanensis TaxID=2569853 RepID=A0A6G2B9P2_9ACTN|nr:DUF397 domain-containing protein [Streptomyces taklimakanensis]MTE18980.1 DUF397 domain-containing protein [Streptomyces taklimakanensis]